MIDFASLFFPKQEPKAPEPVKAEPKQPARVGALWVGWPIDEEYVEFKEKNGEPALSRKLDLDHDKMMVALGRTDSRPNRPNRIKLDLEDTVINVPGD